MSLCAPLVIADQRTHTLATSQPAPDAPWPRVLGLLNAPIEWGGTTWVSINWDFVAGLASPRSRRELFIHEMFHRVQPALRLMQPAAANEHVDAMDGRYWLRLEWRALARALQEIRSRARGRRSRRGRIHDWRGGRTVVLQSVEGRTTLLIERNHLAIEDGVVRQLR